MAIRTSDNAVKGILVDDYDSDRDDPPSLDPYIETAAAIVDRLAAAAPALSAHELELIERWLAAHCYTCMDQTYVSRSTNGGSGTFRGQNGEGLRGSNYGRMALNIDYTGTLMSLDKGGNSQRIEANWLGKTPNEAIPYWER